MLVTSLLLLGLTETDSKHSSALGDAGIVAASYGFRARPAAVERMHKRHPDQARQGPANLSEEADGPEASSSLDASGP
jgi:hypothetical protein